MSIVKKYTETSLVLRIVIGLVLGTILGLFLPEWTGISILGQLFVGALKAIAPVLVAILVASSVAQANGGLGPRFRTVITLYLVTTMIAAIVAVVGSFLFPVSMVLKEGAQVMFVKNNWDKDYYNGKIGRVVAMDGQQIIVETEDEDGTRHIIIYLSNEHYLEFIGKEKLETSKYCYPGMSYKLKKEG